MAGSNRRGADFGQTVRSIKSQIEVFSDLSVADLRSTWRSNFRSDAPKSLTRELLIRLIAWKIQEKAFGGHDRATLKLLDSYTRASQGKAPLPRRLQSGTVLVREYQGVRHSVTIARDGFIWRENTYSSLTQIAGIITGKKWNGPRFFGLRAKLGQSNGPTESAA